MTDEEKRAKAARVRAYRQAHPEKYRAYVREYKRTHPPKPKTEEQKARERERRRARYASDPAVRESQKQRNKEWREKNARHVNEYTRAWYAKNRDRAMAIQKRYQEKKKREREVKGEN